jgi:hypothetical protein
MSFQRSEDRETTRLLPDESQIGNDNLNQNAEVDGVSNTDYTPKFMDALFGSH